MNARWINALVFAALYVAFLAWYDGWGQSPLTPTEVEEYLAGMPADTQSDDFAERMRQMGADDDGNEIYMLNLNRYRYADGENEDAPPAAYRKYGSSVVPMILRNGGHPIYVGTFPSGSIEASDEATDWDEVLLVRYRSRRDFIRMVTSAAYIEAARDRSVAIAYAEVTPTTAQMSLAAPRLIVFLLLLVPALLNDYRLRRRVS